MWNGRKCLLAALTVFAFFGSASRTSAFYPLFASYKINSSNNRFVFVMIVPSTLSEELKPYIEEKRERIRAIRSLYPRSGLYRNDGTNIPLWTVDWYSSNVEAASDGVHLVRCGGIAMSMDDEAIGFFANGVLIRTYRIREFVDFPSLLPHNVSHFEWIEKRHLDDYKLQYSLTTKDGNQFTFDMQTGEIVSASRPGRWLVGGLLLSMTVILCGSVWVFERKRKRV